MVGGDGGPDKSESWGRNGLGAEGSVETGLADGLAGLTSTVHEIVARFTGRTLQSIRRRIHHAGLAGWGIGTFRAGIVGQVVEVWTAGCAEGCVGA